MTLADYIIPRKTLWGAKSWKHLSHVLLASTPHFLLFESRAIALSLHHCDWLFPLSACKASSENHSIDKSTQKKGFTPRACMEDGGSGPWAPGIFKYFHVRLFIHFEIGWNAVIWDLCWIIFAMCLAHFYLRDGSTSQVCVTGIAFKDFLRVFK